MSKKNSSHKLLFLAILGASASAMNKFCADGQCGADAGKKAVEAGNLAKSGLNKFIAYIIEYINGKIDFTKVKGSIKEFIQKNLTLNKIITSCAKSLSTTKGNLLKNVDRFKVVYLGQQ